MARHLLAAANNASGRYVSAYAESQQAIHYFKKSINIAINIGRTPHEMGRYYTIATVDDTTPRYDEAAAKLAWQRTIGFFNTYLRG